MKDKTNTTHGGPRRGAGRPRKGALPRVSMTISVDADILALARELRAAGIPIGDRVAGFIRSLYHQHFTL